MENEPNLTSGFTPDLSRCIQQSVPGMAHFAGTGPAGATCKTCAHLGYERLTPSLLAKHFGGCAKFRKLTGRHGPRAIPPSTPACRYFEQRAEGK